MCRHWMWAPLAVVLLWLPLGCSSSTDTKPNTDTPTTQNDQPDGTAPGTAPGDAKSTGGSNTAGGPSGTGGAAKTNSNVLLSWRVAILPYIEQKPLYDQFHLNEPWDSPHNKALIEKMPEIYKVSDQAKPGHTQFLAVQGEGMAVDGLKPRSLRDVTDGTSNTIWLVTVKPEYAVPWTKPDGLHVNPADPSGALQKLGGVAEGFIAGFYDGSVRVLDPENLQPETFTKLVQIADGQPIDRTEFDPTGGLDFGPPPLSPPGLEAPTLPGPADAPPEPAFPPPECQDEPTTESAAPAGAAPAGATPQAAAAAPAESISDLAYIPQNAVAVLSLRPQTVLTSQIVQTLGQEQQMQLRMGMAMMQGMTGIDPNTIERLSIVLWPGESQLIPAQGPGPKFDAAAFIRLSQPIKLDQIKNTVAQQVPFKLAEGKAGDVTYAFAEGDEAPPVAVAVPNDKLIVIGSKANIASVLTKPAAASGLYQKVAQTDMDQTVVLVARLEPIREDLQKLAANAPKLPDAPDAEELTSELDGLTFALNLTDGLKLHVQLDASKPEMVQELKAQFDQWREKVGESRAEMVGQFAQQYDQQTAQQVQQVADQVFESLKASVDGDMLNVSVTVPKSAVDLAKKLGEVAARQAELRNQAKQIILALHNYHDVNGKLPFPGVVKK